MARRRAGERAGTTLCISNRSDRSCSRDSCDAVARTGRGTAARETVRQRAFGPLRAFSHGPRPDIDASLVSRSRRDERGADILAIQRFRMRRPSPTGRLVGW